MPGVSCHPCQLTLYFAYGYPVRKLPLCFLFSLPTFATFTARDSMGLRHTTAASIRTRRRNASARGYADYMQTPPFRENLDRLIGIARKKKTAILCAEALPWRCHRSVVADALLVRGITVGDIIGETGVRPHAATPFAKIDAATITCPAH